MWKERTANTEETKKEGKTIVDYYFRVKENKEW